MAQGNTINRSELNAGFPAAQPAFFVMKVREEKLDDGRIEWRGEVLDVYGNSVHTFEDWPDLVNLIADALDNMPTAGQGTQSFSSSRETRFPGSKQ